MYLLFNASLNGSNPEPLVAKKLGKLICQRMKVHRNSVWNKEDLHNRKFMRTPRFSS